MLTRYFQTTISDLAPEQKLHVPFSVEVEVKWTGKALRLTDWGGTMSSTITADPTWRLSGIFEARGWPFDDSGPPVLRRLIPSRPRDENLPDGASFKTSQEFRCVKAGRANIE